MTTTYLSVDIEADGPIPGPFSMLSFGVVAFDEKGQEIGAFKRNLERLQHAMQHPKTMAWWAERQAAYDKTRVECVSPHAGMRELDEWMRGLSGKKTFVGYPASYDFLFLYWYLQAFLGIREWVSHSSLTGEVTTSGRVALNYECPFGFQALDIKTLAMIPLACDFHEVSKRKMPKAWFEGQPKHTHDPLDDARGQGMLFFKVLRAAISTACNRTAYDALVAAIRKHRDQRGDDRCWLDDAELYRVLGGEPFEPKDCALPDPEKMLANCQRFIASRHPDGVPYISEQREIQRLREVVRCQALSLEEALEVHEHAERQWFAAAELERAHRLAAEWRLRAARHETQAKLIERDGLMCETHPGTAWPHDDCAGPGMPWMIEGKDVILGLAGKNPTP